MHTRRTLLGIGAVAGALSIYLYKHPKLRKQMHKAKTVREAAGMLGHQLRTDSANVAHDIVTTMKKNASTGTARMLGRRFDSATTKARYARDMAKEEIRHAAKQAKLEARKVKEAATA